MCIIRFDSPKRSHAVSVTTSEVQIICMFFSIHSNCSGYNELMELLLSSGSLNEQICKINKGKPQRRW